MHIVRVHNKILCTRTFKFIFKSRENPHLFSYFCSESIFADLYRFTYLMNILHIYLPRKCFTPRNLVWRQRQMRGFSGSQITRWVVMVMSLRGVPCSCRRIFFTQYRRETVRHKSGLNCRVTRGYCKNRRRVKRALYVTEKYHAARNEKYIGFVTQ